MGRFNDEDFIVRYPGVYDEKEQEGLKKFWAEAEAINHRGDIDVQALINGTLPKDTTGVGPVIHVTEAMVRYNHAKYEQDNPLFNDPEYAKYSAAWQKTITATSALRYFRVFFGPVLE